MITGWTTVQLKWKINILKMEAIRFFVTQQKVGVFRYYGKTGRYLGNL